MATMDSCLKGWELMEKLRRKRLEGELESYTTGKDISKQNVQKMLLMEGELALLRGDLVMPLFTDVSEV